MTYLRYFNVRVEGYSEMHHTNTLSVYHLSKLPHTNSLCISIITVALSYLNCQELMRFYGTVDQYLKAREGRYFAVKRVGKFHLLRSLMSHGLSTSVKGLSDLRRSAGSISIQSRQRCHPRTPRPEEMVVSVPPLQPRVLGITAPLKLKARPIFSAERMTLRPPSPLIEKASSSLLHSPTLEQRGSGMFPVSTSQGSHHHYPTLLSHVLSDKADLYDQAVGELLVKLQRESGQSVIICYFPMFKMMECGLVIPQVGVALCIC